MRFGVETEFPKHGCAIVFGGSGGLGKAIAGLLAERGSNILLTYNSRADHAQAVAQEIERKGQSAAIAQCNVTEATSVQASVDAALSEFGSIHSAISASGLMFGVGMLAEVSESDFRDVVDTDVIGFFNIIKSVVPPMRANGGGSITALVTCATQRTLPADALSAVPKAAVAMMIKHLAAEEGRHGIRANAIGPGLINAGIGVSMAESAKDVMDQVIQLTPLNRLGSAEEFAEAAVFLASAKAGFVTGQVLMADGGLSA